METKISNFIKYLLKNYPYKSELSASRLTKMLYLADWKSAIEESKQLTDAEWHFNHYGPYVDDFIKIAKDDSDIKVYSTQTMFGGHKQQVELRSDFNRDIELEKNEKKILDFVIESTKSKNYEDFIKLVYSTYPVVSSSKYNDLDLVKMAQEYREISEKSSNKALHRTSR
ncbi:Panacea domain-containing protein [Shewanella algae]|uniref:Panacea domain-containing protein n=1 Tax=Shewanella algae TaxID=38313 RepID=UPI001AAD7606|nr:Panacea domain-containing protein [Shewanella algae]EKT4489718.1 SocA family protein [Shewanella algae]MBO2549067.1 SocA family protein [Shewanella algae]MCT8980266.1 Panacea domain-containing protein [Shewanella algae]QTE89913.1 SocA family protein [Shewanella algae]